MAAENFKVKRGLEVGTGSTITSGGVNVTGIITAVQFNGDGSGLTGVVGSGSGVVVKDEGSAVGTAGTINFVGTGVVATLSAGIATVTVSSGGLDDVSDDTNPQLGGNLDLNSKFITGSGGINVTGVVTATTLKGNGDFVDIDVDGHTELDNLNVAGVSTFTGITTFSNDITFSGSSASIYANWDQSGNALFFRDNSHAKFGNNNGMELTHSGGAAGNGNINNRQGGLVIRTTGSDAGDIFIDSKDDIQIRTHDTSDSILCTGGGAVKLYFAGNEKLTTTGTGIEVPDLSVTGVGTIGRVDVNGLVFGTNATTFAAKFPDDAVANFGTDNDLKISHDDTHARITNTKGDIVVSGIISATSDIKVGSAITMNPTSGIITATKFVGDGSGLTGVTASGTGIIVKHDGSTVGTAGTINFSTNLDVTPIHAGIVTVTASGSGGGVSLANGVDNRVVTATGAAALNGEANLTWDGTTLAVTGNQTVSQSVVVGSAVTVNSGGIIATGVGITAASVVVGSGVTIDSNGINAPTGTITAYNLIANHRLTVGSGIYGTEKILLSGGGGGDTNHYAGGTSYSQHVFRLLQGGSSLTRFRISVQGAVVSGICTATTFSGAGTSLTSLPAEELTGTIAGGRFPTTLPAVSGESLTNLTGASSGTYGSSSLIPMITVDSNGRITGIATTSVSSGGGATDKIEEGNSSVEVIDTGTGKIDVIADGSYVSRFQKVTGNRTYMLVGNPLAVSNDYGTNDGHLIIVGNSLSEPATLRLFGWGSGSSDGTINNRIDFASHQSGSGGQTFAKIETVIRGSSDNSSDLTFHTASSATVSEKVRIRATGNVGIGITNPTSKLHVNGDAKVVGVMTATSFVGNLSDAVTSRWTVVGGSVYAFTGPGGLSSTNQPKIYLARGQTYEFVISNASSHPFQIQQSNGSAYNTGVTNNGSNTNGVVVKFEVPFSAPNSLQYACTVHSGMGNTIIVYPDLSP